jgi:putative transposase
MVLRFLPCGARSRCRSVCVDWHPKAQVRDVESERRSLVSGRFTRAVRMSRESPPTFVDEESFKHLLARGITHRRRGYCDPESQAFIESWFGRLKHRLIWRSEFETLDHASTAIAAYIDDYHHRLIAGSATEPPPRSAPPGKTRSLTTEAT